MTSRHYIGEVMKCKTYNSVSSFSNARVDLPSRKTTSVTCCDFPTAFKEVDNALSSKKTNFIRKDPLLTDGYIIVPLGKANSLVVGRRVRNANALIATCREIISVIVHRAQNKGALSVMAFRLASVGLMVGRRVLCSASATSRREVTTVV